MSDATRRKIEAYARDELGHETYAPWLMTYAALRGKFVEGCLPDNYVARHLVPFSNGGSQGLGRKTVFRRLVPNAKLSDVAYRFGGYFFDRDMQAIPPANLKDVLFADYDVIYAKPSTGQQGKGIVKVSADAFDPARLPKGEIVLQGEVPLHPDYAAFSAGGTTTLRITTVHPGEGDALAVAAYIKVGLAGDSHANKGSSIRIGLDVESGGLHAEGVHADWTPTTFHPDTNMVFDGQAIPHFAAARDASVALHNDFPIARYIGWDVGIDPDGIPWFYEMTSATPMSAFRSDHWPAIRAVGVAQIARAVWA